MAIFNKNGLTLVSPFQEQKEQLEKNVADYRNNGKF